MSNLSAHPREGGDLKTPYTPQVPACAGTSGFPLLAALGAVLSGCRAWGQPGCEYSGGVWVAEEMKCHCSAFAQGLHEDKPTIEQLKYRAWCERRETLDEMR